jgi:hypothetical protein
MSEKSDSESICSDTSQISVAYNGDDNMPLDDACDMIFKEIQQHINEIHVQLRMLCQSEDRSDTYDEAFEYHDVLTDHVKEACTVFKDVIKVSKQLLPKKPKGWTHPKKAQGNQDTLPLIQEE